MYTLIFLRYEKTAKNHTHTNTEKEIVCLHRHIYIRTYQVHVGDLNESEVNELVNEWNTNTKNQFECWINKQIN